MSAVRILAMVPCKDRKRIVAECLPTLRAALTPADAIWCYNDGSSEYDAQWLHQFCDRVIEFPVSIGIERQRRRHFNDFAAVQEDFSHVYMTDSDAFHDPRCIATMLRLQGEIGGSPICSYNTSAHERIEGNLIEDDPQREVLYRRVAPGVSYLLTRAQARMVVNVIQYMNDPLHWDWTVPKILGSRFAITRTSYVDHIGAGGLHHPKVEGLDGGDRATNPTPYLIEKRAQIIAKLSS